MKKGDKKERKKVLKLAKEVDKEKALLRQRQLRESLIPIAYKYSDEELPAWDADYKYDTVGEQVRAKMAVKERAKKAFPKKVRRSKK